MYSLLVYGSVSRLYSWPRTFSENTRKTRRKWETLTLWVFDCLPKRRRPGLRPFDPGIQSSRPYGIEEIWKRHSLNTLFLLSWLEDRIAKEYVKRGNVWKVKESSFSRYINTTCNFFSTCVQRKYLLPVLVLVIYQIQLPGYKLSLIHIWRCRRRG